MVGPTFVTVETLTCVATDDPRLQQLTYGPVCSVSEEWEAAF